MTAMRAYLAGLSALASGLFGVASAITGDATAQPLQVELVSAPDHAHPQGARYQIDPTADLRRIFPKASQISVGVAVVPDPMVPRYRRLYDLSVEAIELGMLEAGYMLDRYSLPWDEQLKAVESSEKAESGSADGAAALDEKGDDPSYGLLVFRCDTWRSGDCSGNLDAKSRFGAPAAAGERRSRVRALYVVTDTATYGLSDQGLRKAAKRISSQLSTNQPTGPQVALLAFPACLDSGRSPLVVLGPNFSGALDSVGEHSASVVQSPITGICLISSSATNPTNQLINQSYSQVQYVPLALNDWRKLAHVAGLARQLLGRKAPNTRDFQDVTILAEASTFGFGACEQPSGPIGNYLSSDADERAAEQLCHDARLIYFPASIADVRDEVQHQQDEARHDAHNPLRMAVPDDDLPLKMRTENGSEYPESRQSESTTASKQLALEQLLDRFNAFEPPQIVIVVATDVRDRLFLFDKLRARLPRAMFVDLDADNLVAHHAYLHASRGAVAIGSAKLLVNGHRARDARDAAYRQPRRGDRDIYGCRTLDSTADPYASIPRRAFSSWSSDSQAILADSVGRLYEPGSARTAAPCFVDSKEVRRATVQVVTLEGLRQISNAFAPDPRPPAWPLQLLEGVEALAPFFCIAVAWIWIAPLIPSRASPQVVKYPLWQQAGTIGTVETAAIFCVCFAALSLVLSFVFKTSDRDNPLFFWLLAASTFGAWRLVACNRLLRQTRGGATQFDSRQALAPLGLAFAAALLAATPWWWQRIYAHAGSNEFLDHNALIKLAFDPDAGLAFFLVAALGASALLYASLTFEMGATIIQRNLDLMRATRRVIANSRLAPGLKSELLGPLPIQIAAVVLIAAMTVPDLFGGVRLTVFGLFVSRVVLVALMTTTIVATMSTLAALHAGRRIIGLSGHMRNAYLTSRKATVSDPSREIPGFWAPGSSTPTTFPATPVTADISHLTAATAALLEPNQTERWNGLLNDWLHKGCDDDSEHRAAVFLLLATEIGVHRWLVAGAVICALASVGIVYLFPIESDTLLLLNLGLLIAAGAIAGYMATTFEGDGLLSNVLCNRPRKGKLSITLIVFIAAPFLALSGAIAVTRIPGAVDWSGGLIGLLLGLGLHP